MTIVGIILAITSALCWGTGAVFSRLGLCSLKAQTGTLVSMFSSVLLVGTLALTINFSDVMSITPRALWWFALVGVINYVLGRQFNYLSISYIGVSRATTIFAASPLFAIILAVTLTGESINAAIITGTLIVIGGLYLVVSSQ